MPSAHSCELVQRFLACLCCAAAAVHVQAAVIGPELQRAMASRGTHADTAVIVRYTEPVDPQAHAVTDRRLRDNRLMLALKARAERQRAQLEPLLAAVGATHVHELWIVNGLAATVPAVAVKQLAAHPGVDRIELDSRVQAGRSQRLAQARLAPAGAASAASVTNAASAGQAAPATAPAEGAAGATRPTPAWNITAVHAPELWALGHAGQGVVVAGMDSGADQQHPALRHSWRGGGNSWFDVHGEEASPYDATGHGTQAMGVMVGTGALGVAPAARWIAVRLYDRDGRASMSDIHRAFQWLMDPDGDPATVDAPDIVNASWALAGRAGGACFSEFSDDIRALRSAGIAVVFAAGNDGPALRTSSSPGNNPGVMSIGAVDRDGELSRQSSRGPSACDGAVFPRLVAPGVNVRTADLSHGGLLSYTAASGSSLAAPHAAGVLALLAGAFPSASVPELESALLRGARDLGEPGPDNLYGHGLVDALAAYEILRAVQPQRAPAAALNLH
jgi:bacillopeptidase F